MGFQSHYTIPSAPIDYYAPFMNLTSPYPASSGEAIKQEMELSIVFPCLNESETVGTCVRKAVTALKENGIRGEVIVADNGSNDGSQEIARSEGAKVISIPTKGYGSALRGGISAASGEYVLMADSDDSYDLSHIPRFLEQ